MLAARTDIVYTRAKSFSFETKTKTNTRCTVFNGAFETRRRTFRTTRTYIYIYLETYVVISKHSITKSTEPNSKKSARAVRRPNARCRFLVYDVPWFVRRRETEHRHNKSDRQTRTGDHYTVFQKDGTILKFYSHHCRAGNLGC